MKIKETEILEKLQPLLNEPAVRYVVELLLEYRQTGLERLTECDSEEFKVVQGECRAYKKILGRLTKAMQKQALDA